MNYDFLKFSLKKGIVKTKFFIRLRKFIANADAANCIAIKDKLGRSFQPSFLVEIIFSNKVKFLV